MLTSVPPEEVQLFVSLPTKASGNSLRENILSFEALSSRIQFSQLCEKTHFQHRVSDGRKKKKLDLTRTTGGEALFVSVGTTHFLVLILNHKRMEQFLGEQLLDQLLKFES